MSRSRRPASLNVLLLTAALAVGALPLSATVALADEKATDSSVHVFPGAVPINGKAEQPQGESTNAKQESSAAAKEEQSDESTANSEDAVHDPEAANATIEQNSPDAVEAQKRATNTALDHYNLGTHYFQKWDLDLAETEFDEAIRYMPDMKIAHRDLCLVSLMRCNPLRSAAEFMMVVGLGDAIPLNDQEKTALDSRAYKQHYKKALAWGKDRKWDDAIAELQWAEGYQPKNPAVHHSLAFAYASKGDFNKAEQEYAETFSEAPNDGYAHADFANMLADKGNKQMAEDELRKAVQLEPNAAALHVDLGWMAESRNDVPTAAQEFQTAVKLSPDHAGLWEHLGRLLEKQSKYAEAQSAYAKALSLDPQLTEAKENLERLQKQTHA